MSRLVSADILPDLSPKGEVQVLLTWQTSLVARSDWKALSSALLEKDIPRQTHTQTRSYASLELAQRAIRTLGGKVEA